MTTNYSTYFHRQHIWPMTACTHYQKDNPLGLDQFIKTVSYHAALISSFLLSFRCAKLGQTELKNIKSVVVLPLAVSVNSAYSLLHLSVSKWQTAGSTAATAGLTATPFWPTLQQQMIYIMISQPYDHIQGTNQCSWPSLHIKQKTKWKQCTR